MDDLPTLTYVLLIPLGLVIATYRTLSGFFIVRIVLLLFPHASANAVASISLAMIVLERLSFAHTGTSPYACGYESLLP
jgi:hypothetical protein